MEDSNQPVGASKNKRNLKKNKNKNKNGHRGSNGQTKGKTAKTRNFKRRPSKNPKDKNAKEKSKEALPSELNDFIASELSTENKGETSPEKTFLSSTTRAAFTKEKYADCKSISNQLKHNIASVLKYEYLTKVQAAAIPVAVQGVDCLVKAKTGTGKTIAFLVPAIERLLKHSTPADRNGKVQILVISPTRELASQIFEEGKKLLNGTSVTIQCVFGGTKMGLDLKGFRKSNFPDVIVATPGRIDDHLTSSGLQVACNELKCLIFDEADRLLEMGFRPSITQILNKLPPTSKRQTLLYSATMPEDINSIAQFALKKEYKLIDCVGEDDQGTHEHVPQSCIMNTSEAMIAELFYTLKKGMTVSDYKIIVFFVTARLTQFFAAAFSKLGIDVLEIHSRKSQSYRSKVSKTFKEESNHIIFSSDVTARGMDYPDVTMVVQVGLPSDTAQYIHRLGRTARIGKKGRGMLLLSEFEAPFLKEISDQPVEMERPNAGKAEIEAKKAEMGSLVDQIDPKLSMLAYQSYLGYYNSNRKRILRATKKEHVVQLANTFATVSCCMKEPPALSPKVVGKMGLRGVAGLRIDRSEGGKATAGFNSNMRHRRQKDKFSARGKRGRNRSLSRDKRNKNQGQGRSQNLEHRKGNSNNKRFDKKVPKKKSRVE